MSIYARIGDKNLYTVDRGARVECGDGENMDGVPILGWDCDYPAAKAFAVSSGIVVDWDSCWDADEGHVEAPILCNLDSSMVKSIADRINAAAEAAS